MYQGDKVKLRAFESGDLERNWEYVNDYQTLRTMGSGMLFPSSRTDEARWLDQQTSYTRGEYQFAIELLETGEMIGRCGLIRVDWKNRWAELGIMIGPREYRGRGYGTDALQTLCRFCFDEMNLHKLKMSVIDFNGQALGCYEKCGFSREGVLRGEVFREGAYHDVIVMGRIKE